MVTDNKHTLSKTLFRGLDKSEIGGSTNTIAKWSGRHKDHPMLTVFGKDAVWKDGELVKETVDGFGFWIHPHLSAKPFEFHLNDGDLAIFPGLTA